MSGEGARTGSPRPLKGDVVEILREVELSNSQGMLDSKVGSERVKRGIQGKRESK